MKKNNQSINTLVLITNRQLLKDDMSLATYGAALSKEVERLQKYGKNCINHIEEKGLPCDIHRGYESTVTVNLDSNRLFKRGVDSVETDRWMRNHHNLYTLCRDTDLLFEEYIQLCDAIGSTVVYHGKVITKRVQLEIILNRQPRIHMPTNLIRHWQSEQEDLWNTFQSHWNSITVWSTVHNEDDIKLLASLGIPNLECVLISPIFPTPCKEGHPGIGVKRGKELLEGVQAIYPYAKGIALGGIHRSNYIECLNHAFTGVAIMSDFMKQVHNDI